MPQVQKPPSYERDPQFWEDHSECVCGATFSFEEFNEDDECPNCQAETCSE